MMKSRYFIHDDGLLIVVDFEISNYFVFSLKIFMIKVFLLLFAVNRQVIIFVTASLCNIITFI